MVAIATLTYPTFSSLCHSPSFSHSLFPSHGHMAYAAAGALLIRRVTVLKCKEMLEEQRVCKITHIIQGGTRYSIPI